MAGDGASGSNGPGLRQEAEGVQELARNGQATNLAVAVGADE